MGTAPRLPLQHRALSSSIQDITTAHQHVADISGDLSATTQDCTLGRPRRDAGPFEQETMAQDGDNPILWLAKPCFQLDRQRGNSSKFKKTSQISEPEPSQTEGLNTIRQRLTLSVNLLRAE